MKHIVPHDIGAARARQLAERAFVAYRERFPSSKVTLAWRDAASADVQFSAKGITLNGAVTVSDREIALELDVPFLLRPFQKKAIEVIEREIRHWLDKAETEPA